MADADFPPFSFLSSSNAPAGMAVELALAACAEAKLRCSVTPLPFDRILGALADGSADVAVTGPRLDEPAYEAASATRPWFRIMGRFATAAKSPLDSGLAIALVGKKIGVVKETVHARWLAAYYPGSEIVLFDSLAAAGDALKAAKVDVLFGDNLQVIYWVAGEAAAGCCRLLDGAFSDFDYFSRNLAFLVRRDRPELRAAFDYGLDLAQKSGATARIVKAYVPLPPW